MGYDRCLTNRFDWINNSLRLGLGLHHKAIFNVEVQNLCAKATDHFLRTNAQCAFFDLLRGEKCTNTKPGHKIGHQSQGGRLLSDGEFVPIGLDSNGFLSLIKASLYSILRDIPVSESHNLRECRRITTNWQKQAISHLRELGGFPHPIASSSSDVSKACKNLCFGCFMGRPEYQLPCQHVICVKCLEDFDQTERNLEAPGRFSLHSCLICGDSSSGGWPYVSKIRPELGGLRILSLDGGGVRGIVELTVLRRLEESIGLGLPLGHFFDLIVGTSTGKRFYNSIPGRRLLEPSVQTFLSSY